MDTLSGETAEAIRQRLHGQLLTPQDGGLYREAARTWNRKADGRPAAVLKPAGTADVVEALQLAQRMRIGVTVACGRCSSLCQRNGLLCIDLCLMRAVLLDKANQVVYVQGGARVKDVVAECGVHEMQPVLPGHPAVGVSSILRGGMGYLSPQHGLALDNVVSLEVVTAQGRVVRCSATEEPELFWAMRGAGSNFGIVTLLVLRLFPLCRVYGGVLMSKAAEDLTRQLLRLQRYSYSDPSVFVTTFSAGIDYHAASLFLLKFAASEQEGDKAIEAFKCFPMAADSCTWQLYKTVTSLTENLMPSANAYVRDLLVADLTDEVIEKVANSFASRPSVRCMVRIWPLGLAANAVPVEATAFFHRQARFQIFICATWDEQNGADGDGTGARDWADLFFRQLAPHALGIPADVTSLHGDEDLRLVYGDHLPRLQALKKLWDPDNVFRFNLNIPPAE